MAHERLLEKEQAFFYANREELRAKYGERYLVIVKDQIHGDFETLVEAVEHGAEQFGAGPFLAISPTEDGIRINNPAFSAGLLACRP
jgi:hypothetical protein